MKPDDITIAAMDIVDEYQSNYGIQITLRQLYYQFVGRGLVDNSDKVYKRIGATLTKARLKGTFPVDGLIDTARTVELGSFKTDLTNVDQALNRAASDIAMLPEKHLWRAAWYKQPVHVSVWVEKDALSTVFAPVCEQLGVSWFACRGYPSISSLGEWLRYTGEVIDLGFAKKAVILYFGDHDPDGWQIPRSALNNLRQLQNVTDNHFDIELARVSLNQDQIQTYDPPPVPGENDQRTVPGLRERARHHGRLGARRTRPADAAAFDSRQRRRALRLGHPPREPRDGEAPAQRDGRADARSEMD